MGSTLPPSFCAGGRFLRVRERAEGRPHRALLLAADDVQRVANTISGRPGCPVSAHVPTCRARHLAFVSSASNHREQFHQVAVVVSLPSVAIAPALSIPKIRAACVGARSILGGSTAATLLAASPRDHRAIRPGPTRPPSVSLHAEPPFGDIKDDDQAAVPAAPSDRSGARASRSPGRTCFTCSELKMFSKRNTSAGLSIRMAANMPLPSRP